MVKNRQNSYSSPRTTLFAGFSLAFVLGVAPRGQLELRRGSSGPLIRVLSGIDPLALRDYENFGESAPVLQVAPHMTCGEVFFAMATRGNWIERSAFYQEWARPQGLHEIAAIKFLHETGTFGVLVCAPKESSCRKTAADAPRLLQRLAPHLQRAMRVHLRMHQLCAENQAALDALDLLTSAVFIVDAQAHIQFANRAAEEVLRQSDGVMAGPNGMRAFQSTQTIELHALVARAAGIGQEVAVGGAMTIERPSLKRAYQVLVSPLSVRPSWAFVAPSSAVAVVLIVDPELPAQDVEEQLRAFYGLTPAEARVARAVGRGDDLNAVADSLGVLPSTARTHLHHVFQKTETRTQAELVRLVERTPVVARITSRSAVPQFFFRRNPE